MNELNECIFCKIIKGELPSYTVYEDDDIKVIMNINPTTNGHLLLLPKKHLETFLDVSQEFITHAFEVIQEKVYPLLKEKLNCDGLTFSQNNFYGQEIKHFHIHITPRYEGDLVDYQYNKEMLEDVEDVFFKLLEDELGK